MGESELASKSQILHVALEWSTQSPLYDWSTQLGWPKNIYFECPYCAGNAIVERRRGKLESRIVEMVTTAHKCRKI